MVDSIHKNGGSAPLDVIYKYVSKRWGSVRRRDGSIHNPDCKKAVKSALADNTSLFKPDDHNDAHWKVSKSALKVVATARQEQARSEESPRLTDMQVEYHTTLPSPSMDDTSTRG